MVDFANHDDIERQKFWMRKSDPRASGKETYEWDGEEWKCMDGYYDCLFCKRKVGCTTKEKHLVHNKKGILTTMNTLIFFCCCCLFFIVNVLQEWYDSIALAYNVK